MSEPSLSADRLDQIEAHHAEHCSEACCHGEPPAGCDVSHCTTLELLAEVRWLREDRDRWKAAAEYHYRDVKAFVGAD